MALPEVVCSRANGAREYNALPLIMPNARRRGAKRRRREGVGVLVARVPVEAPYSTALAARRCRRWRRYPWLWRQCSPWRWQ